VTDLPTASCHRPAGVLTDAGQWRFNKAITFNNSGRRPLREEGGVTVQATLLSPDLDRTSDPPRKAPGISIPHGTAEFALACLAFLTVAGASALIGRRSAGALSAPVLLLAVWILGLSTSAAIMRRRRHARMAQTIARLEAVADGDLSIRSGTRRMESAEAAAIDEATDRLAARLRADVTTLELAATRLNLGWQEVYDVGRTMLEMSENTVHDAALAADSADHVSQNMQYIATAMGQMAAAIREVAGNASQASAVANTGAREVTEASGTMAELQRAADEVQDAVKLISTFASQTRVLALNATIEASRDTDARRGFVVVADSVKELAQQTADATGDVTSTVRAIQDASVSAVKVMGTISDVMRQVSDNQTAIATAVEEQTETTAEVRQSSSVAAEKAVELAHTVQALTDALRLTGYGGAQAKVAAAHLTELEESILGVANNYHFDRHVAAPAVDAGAPPTGIAVNGTVTTVQDYVIGSGINEFDYHGRWEHAVGNVEADGSDSFSSIPGDTVLMRFVGTRVRLFGVGAQNHGTAEVSVDDGPAFVVDEYAEERQPGTLYWESPLLSRGEHVLCLRVTGRANPRSKYYWVTVDYVEIDD